MKKFLIAFLALFILTAEGETTVKSGSNVLTFDRNGAIKKITEGNETLAMHGTFALWRVVFSDGSQMTSAEFPPVIRNVNGGVELCWTSSKLDVTVLALPVADGSIDLSARIKPKNVNAEEFHFPDQLNFLPEKLDGFHVNIPLPRNPGMRLNRKFFQDCTGLPDPLLRVEKHGSSLYQALFGRTPAPYIRFRGKPEFARDGKKIFTVDFSERLRNEEMVLDRPCSGFNADLKLLRLDKHEILAGSRLGKNGGALIRLGGHFSNRVRNGELIRTLIAETASALVRNRKAEYSAALIAPAAVTICQETASSPEEWRKTLEKYGFRVRMLTSGEAVLDALKHSDNEIIVNPHGSTVLMPEACSDADFATAMKDFVGRGNYWFECAGYSFFNRFVPIRYLKSDRLISPSILADFVHFDFGKKSLSLYSVQPMAYAPFERSRSYIPAFIEFGGKQSGGFYKHGYLFFVPKGKERQAPVFRLRFGNNAFTALQAFAKDHHLTRKLSEKVSPELLKKMQNSIICKFASRHLGDAVRLPELLPAPMIYHTTRYLNGGPLDKGYPDHLPVRAEWASPEEFRGFLKKVHDAGSLFMPYTNNTWWCDNPRGPTFSRIGDAPLLRQKNGSLAKENYGSGKTGFTLSPWHPEARKAAQMILDGFIRDYDADIVFQDQVGARKFRWDYNADVPSPDAYSEGIASQARIDSRSKPLATEDIWWGVIDSEVMACGMHFGLTPPRRGAHRKFMKEIYPKSTWNIFPMLQILASDKLMLTPHNLGYNVNGDLGITWSVALGNSLVIHCNSTPKPAELEKILWLDRIQKSVCSRYVGQGISQFRHDWLDGHSEYDDGVIEAQYGPVKVFSNLSGLPVKYEKVQIPPRGFIASAPELSAGIIGSESHKIRFVMDKNRLYCYGLPGSMVEIPGEFRIRGIKIEKVNGFCRFHLPKKTEAFAKFFTFELE